MVAGKGYYEKTIRGHEMKIICCILGSWLIFYALNVAKDIGSTWALILGAIGIGLLIFSDTRRTNDRQQ